MAKLTNEEIIASLKEMTILELNELVKAIETEFDVKAAAPAAGPAAPAEETAAAGPTEVNVMLKEVGQTKIAVIKAVKDASGLSLMDAKKIVDAVTPEAGALIKEHCKIEEADAIKAKVVEAGGTVEYK